MVCELALIKLEHSLTFQADSIVYYQGFDGMASILLAS
jgi:hypothetical protein